ncbi:MAG: ftsY [Acidimicrobiales bacterium]|nr:ftsY [Acidimicrobiales bacterium]
MVLPVILIVIALLLVSVAVVAVGRSRRGGVELEPPPTDRSLDTAPPRRAPEVPDELVAEVEAALAPAAEPEVVEAPRRPSFRDRLAKARGAFAGFLGRAKIDAETWDELEEALLRADVGIGPTTELIEGLRTRVRAEGLETGEQLVEAVKDEMKQRLAVADRTLHLDEGRTNVWLFVGVNGVGKTTTVGKVGKRQAAAGHTVVMAAGDTFRAAAAEQLTTWAERAGADLVRGAEGADPSSIIFDAIESAAAKGADLVLADTAGRLHTKTNLMEELRKVKRVASKDPGHVTEVLLVLDATTGQNGLVQAVQFTDAVEVTGVVLTKLDGSAKGGIVFAIQSQLGIPVKLVGLGETADDLVDFDPDEFVDALFAP